MIELFEDILPHLFRRRGELNTGVHLAEEEISAAIEAAVAGAESGIRLVSGYQRKLRDAVASALHYIHELVEQIPGVVDINSRSFGSDPRVNAFFVNVEDMRNAFSRSSELRDFLCGFQHAEMDSCSALLCMKKTERKVLGMELNGDRVQREVPQITVSFSDHQIISPGASEDEVRQGLKQCLFQSLVTNARELLTDCRFSVHQLDAERRSLHARARSLAHPASHGGLAELDSGMQISEVQRKLSELDQARNQKHCLGPIDNLNQLRQVFEQPDDFVRLNRDTLILSRLGVKLEPGSSDGNRVEVAEVELGRSDRRVVVLARFPREDLLPSQDFLSNVSHYLQI
jgi:hypothetical protein